MDVESCKSRARQGDVCAAYVVGCRSIGSDPRAAEEYYILAADAGHTRAQYQLYSLYSTGNGVPKNEVRAAYYLELAANNGLPETEYSLGKLIQEKSPETAAEWFQKASKHEYSAAQCHLAMMYKDGIGVNRNLSQALFWANSSQEATMLRWCLDEVLQAPWMGSHFQASGVAGGI